MINQNNNNNKNVMHIYKISIFGLQFKIFKRVLKILISYR